MVDSSIGEGVSIRYWVYKELEKLGKMYGEGGSRVDTSGRLLNVSPLTMPSEAWRVAWIADKASRAAKGHKLSNAITLTKEEEELLHRVGKEKGTMSQPYAGSVSPKAYAGMDTVPPKQAAGIRGSLTELVLMLQGIRAINSGTLEGLKNPIAQSDCESNQAPYPETVEGYLAHIEELVREINKQAEEIKDYV